MIRLAAVVLGLFAVTQTSAVQNVGADIRDFRERQFVTGQRVGCEIQLAMAATDMDVEGVRILSERCAALELRREQL